MPLRITRPFDDAWEQPGALLPPFERHTLDGACRRVGAERRGQLAELTARRLPTWSGG